MSTASSEVEQMDDHEVQREAVVSMDLGIWWRIMVSKGNHPQMVLFSGIFYIYILLHNLIYISARMD